MLVLCERDFSVCILRWKGVKDLVRSKEEGKGGALLCHSRGIYLREKTVCFL